MSHLEIDPDEAYERAQDRKIEEMEMAAAEARAEAMAHEDRLGLIPDDDYWEEAYCHEWEDKHE